MYGGPVERYTRGICLWQVVHKRRPTASCRREGERLWPVVIHHFQTPVSIEWHGVTWRGEKITRNVDGKEFCVVFSLVVQRVSSHSSLLHRSPQSCCCNEIPDGGAGGSGYCSDHCRCPGGCNCRSDTLDLKGQCQHFIFFLCPWPKI